MSNYKCVGSVGGFAVHIYQVCVSMSMCMCIRVCVLNSLTTHTHMHTHTHTHTHTHSISLSHTRTHARAHTQTSAQFPSELRSDGYRIFCCPHPLLTAAQCPTTPHLRVSMKNAPKGSILGSFPQNLGLFCKNLRPLWRTFCDSGGN